MLYLQFQFQLQLQLLHIAAIRGATHLSLTPHLPPPFPPGTTRQLLEIEGSDATMTRLAPGVTMYDRSPAVLDSAAPANATIAAAGSLVWPLAAPFAALQHNKAEGPGESPLPPCSTGHADVEGQLIAALEGVKLLWKPVPATTREIKVGSSAAVMWLTLSALAWSGCVPKAICHHPPSACMFARAAPPAHLLLAWAIIYLHAALPLLPWSIYTFPSLAYPLHLADCRGPHAM